MVNKLRGVLNAVAIKAPGFGERRKSLLQDIAIVTGAEYVAKDLGMKVETTGIESLGTARKVGELTSYVTLCCCPERVTNPRLKRAEFYVPRIKQF